MGGDGRSWGRPSTTDRTPDIVTVVDASGRRRYASPTMEPVLGYAPETLVGEEAFGRVHPDDVGRLIQIFREGVETGRRSAGAVFRYQVADGRWRWLESVGVNLLDEPRIEAVIVDSRDVTGLAARPPRPEGDDVPPETGPFGLLVLDAESEVIAVTPAAAAVAGRDDLVGSRVGSLLPDDWLETAPGDGPLTLLAGGGRRSTTRSGVLELEAQGRSDATLEVSVVPVPAGPIPEPATVVGVREQP